MRNTDVKTKIFSSIEAAFIALYAIFIYSKNDSFLLFFAFFFVSSLLASGLATLLDPAKDIAEYIDYSKWKDRQVLTIKKRGKAIRYKIRIEAVKNYDSSVGYVPEKEHFMAVRTGNVIMGGTYKTGGYTQENITSKKTGTYMLVETSEEYTKRIERIELSPELFEKAMASGVAQYLDKKTKSFIIPHTCQVESAMASGIGRYLDEKTKNAMLMSALRGDVGTSLKTSVSGAPMAQCEEILDWLCNLDG